MTDSKSTIERLQELSILEGIPDYIEYSNTSGENTKGSLEILNKYGWKLTRLVNDAGCFTVNAVSIVSPSVEFINELKILGAYNIIETLHFTVYKDEDVEKVHNILTGDKWSSIEEERLLMESVWGKIPMNTWFIKALKIHDANEVENND